MKLWEIMDKDLYQSMLVQKYIRVNHSDIYDLSIIHYTESAQFDKVWNDVTKQCRGIIVDSQWNIIARPFDKFMNYGENQADKFLMDYRVRVTDKMDGSLGIIYYAPDHGWRVATKGSLHSEQAEWATSKLWTMQKPASFHKEWTYLVEIIYPQNRIVLNYGNTEGLFLIGARDIKSGHVWLPDDLPFWTGPKTRSFPYETLREALEAPPRANAEGYVVYFPDLDYRMKIKQDDYVALHKIVTGLTPRRIWESMKDGKTLFDLLEIVPDEWHEWLSNVHDEIYTDFCRMHVALTNQYEDIRSNIPKDFSKTDFNHLLSILEIEDKGMMFALFEGISIADMIWKRIRPEAG